LLVYQKIRSESSGVGERNVTLVKMLNLSYLQKKNTVSEHHQYVKRGQIL